MCFPQAPEPEVAQNIVPLNLKPLDKATIRPEGTGEEVLLQGFNWDRCGSGWGRLGPLMLTGMPLGALVWLWSTCLTVCGIKQLEQQLSVCSLSQPLPPSALPHVLQLEAAGRLVQPRGGPCRGDCGAGLHHHLAAALHAVGVGRGAARCMWYLRVHVGRRLRSRQPNGRHCHHARSLLCSLCSLPGWCMPQGYLPGDLYNLNSKYGSEAELIGCVKALQNHGIKVLGDAVSGPASCMCAGDGDAFRVLAHAVHGWSSDVRGVAGSAAHIGMVPAAARPSLVHHQLPQGPPLFTTLHQPASTVPPRLQVLNHRCAQFQDEHGVWNKYGGRLSWDQRAIVGACMAPGAVIVALQGLLG